MTSRSMEDARALDTLRAMSRVGMLADEVVLAALRLKRGDVLSDVEPLRHAAELLRELARRLGEPFDVTASSIDADPLGLMSTFNRTPEGGGTAVSSAEQRRRAAEHLSSMSAALTAMVEGAATPDQMRLVQSEFEALARVTLVAAGEAIRPRTMVGQWTPALHS